jgi:reactive intermediate/imine deaminase
MRCGLLVIAALLITTPAFAQEMEKIDSPVLPEGLPFSAAVRVGDILYLSGQIGIKPGTLELVEGGVGPETRQTMENIRTVLEAAGSSLDRVVKCTVFLADIADYAEMNEVYRRYFLEKPPARSTVAGSGLALGARVEIECLALTGG